MEDHFPIKFLVSPTFYYYFNHHRGDHYSAVVLMIGIVRKLSFEFFKISIKSYFSKKSKHLGYDYA